MYRLAYRLRRSDSDEEDEADEVVPELVAAEDEDDEPRRSDVSLRDTEPPHTKPRADETESSRYP